MKKIFTILFLFFITSINHRPLQATHELVNNPSYVSLLLNIGACILGVSNLGEIWLGSKNPFKTNLFKLKTSINGTNTETVCSLLPSIGFKTKTRDINGTIIKDIKSGFWLDSDNGSSSMQTKLSCSILPLALICYGLKQIYQ